MATKAGAPPTTVARRGSAQVERSSTQRDAREALRAELARYAPSFAKVLPKHITPEKLLTLALVAATQNPRLLDCTPESIALSLMKISQWGLEIGRTAHLVPFLNDVKQADDTWRKVLTCTAIPDYKGLIELVLRSRHVRDIYARPVYEGEHFLVRYGTDEGIEHRPNWNLRNPALTHVYSVAKLSEYRFTFEVMTRAEVDAIRAAAPSKDSPAWKNHYVQMTLKTVIKRLCKRLPQTPALEEALDADDQVNAVPLSPAAIDDPYLMHAGSVQLSAGTESTEGGGQPEAGVGASTTSARDVVPNGARSDTDAKAAGPQEAQILTLVENGKIDQETRAKIKGRILRGMTAKEATDCIAFLEGKINNGAASTSAAASKPADDGLPF
jgi:recombination protein RecT